jgi:hypothetical protein
MESISDPIEKNPDATAAEAGRTAPKNISANRRPASGDAAAASARFEMARARSRRLDSKISFMRACVQEIRWAEPHRPSVLLILMGLGYQVGAV